MDIKALWINLSTHHEKLKLSDGMKEYLKLNNKKLNITEYEYSVPVIILITDKDHKWKPVLKKRQWAQRHKKKAKF